MIFLKLDLEMFLLIFVKCFKLLLWLIINCLFFVIIVFNLMYLIFVFVVVFNDGIEFLMFLFLKLWWLIMEIFVLIVLL